MRNLKRALSLALASVMLMGMMVVGAGAKGIGDYSDKAEIVNQDAVAVTTELGIFEGYEDGSFGPEKVVTRAEMAVIICKMLYGSDVNAAQFVQTSVFTDVPAWAAGYVNLCASLNIVAGVGDNKYDPNSTVTTAQAALMLSKALGYFKNDADYGSNWMLASTSKATQLGLYGDLDLAADQGLTRQDVAVMTFNALTTSVPVDYSEMFNVYYNVNSGLIYGLEFNYLETLGYTNFDLVYKNAGTVDDQGRPAITWGTGTVKSNDKKTATDEKGDLISNQVTILSRNEIITMAMAPDYTYTGATKSKAITSDLGKDIAKDGAWTIYYNGYELDSDSAVPFIDNQPSSKPSTADQNKFYLPVGGDAGDYNWIRNGEACEIYLDYDNDGDAIVTAVVYGNYLGEVTRVSGGKVTLTTDTHSPRQNGPKLDNKSFESDEYKLDDLVLYTIGYDNDDNEFFVFSTSTPETVEGAMTSYSVSNMNVYIDKVKTSLSTHFNNEIEVDMSTEATAAKDIDLDNDYRFYLDPNGYVVAVEPIDAKVNRYFYVDAIDFYLTRVQADVVFADGTKETVTISEVYDYSGELAGGFWASRDAEDDLLDIYKSDALVTAIKDHTVNLKDGFVAAYTVNGSKYDIEILAANAVVDTADGKRIENKQSSYEYAAYVSPIGGTKVRLTNETIFVDIESGKLYVGQDNVPDYSGSVWAAFGADHDFAAPTGSTTKVVTMESYADVVFITDGEADGESKTYFWLNDTGKGNVNNIRSNGTMYYEYTKTYVEGTQQDVVIRQTAGNQPMDVGIGLYAVDSTDTNDYAKSVTPLITVSNNAPVGVYTGTKYDFYHIAANNIASAKSNTIYLATNMSEGAVSFDSVATRNASFVYVPMNTKDEVGKGTPTTGSFSDIVTKDDAKEKDYDYYTEIFVIDYKDAKNPDDATIIYLVETPYGTKAPTTPDYTGYTEIRTSGLNLYVAYYGATAPTLNEQLDLIEAEYPEAEFSGSSVKIGNRTYTLVTAVRLAKITVDNSIGLYEVGDTITVTEGKYYTADAGANFVANTTSYTVTTADATIESGFYSVTAGSFTGSANITAGTVSVPANTFLKANGGTVSVTVTATTGNATTLGTTATVAPATATATVTGTASYLNAEGAGNNASKVITATVGSVTDNVVINVTLADNT